MKRRRSEDEEEKEGEEEEEEEEGRRKKRLQPVVVPWRTIYRTLDFFPSFFIPTPRAPRDHFVSFLLPHLSSPSKVAACMLFIFLPALRSFSAPTSSSQHVQSPRVPSAFFLRFSPSQLHVRVPDHSFVESFLLSLLHSSSGRGGGAA